MPGKMRYNRKYWIQTNKQDGLGRVEGMNLTASILESAK